MDFVASLITLIGIYVLGEKHKLGFLICAFGNILWIVYPLIARTSYGLLLSAIPALILNLVSFYKWKKD